MITKPVIVIGYCGHAYVAVDIFHRNSIPVAGYCDRELKVSDPYNLKYLGKETELKKPYYKDFSFFIAIRDNSIRHEVFLALRNESAECIQAIHPQSIIGSKVRLGEGVMIAAGACINALTTIGDGVICNTNCTIEHECEIGRFTHIAPGVVLCDNTSIGSNTFIGANTLVKQGITIGSNCTIGAGSVIVTDIADNMKVFGNPGKVQVAPI